MKAYVCNSCNARVEEDQIIAESDPDLWQHPMRSICEKLRESQGQPTPPQQLYHVVLAHVKMMRGCARRERHLCGPLHEETTQEYFVHWVSH